MHVNVAESCRLVPPSFSENNVVTYMSFVIVLASCPSYTIAYDTCVSAGTATEASGRSGPEMRVNFARFVLATESVPPFGPPLATMLSRVRVERRGTHSPGLFSYASSNMTAGTENVADTDAETELVYGGVTVVSVHTGPVPS